ncbi:hypothetical protein ILUMI_12397 [Ignelater luminosus]|uniref:Amino acid transporter transmembrane domain-containing protein n=1 Tax=Ignelater luminosus TaxID=2038154 RepID=A0A8K0G6T6_IGNLU|nr:hypothetical protein ILUMI_12397 [Ignelater luminosus]
MGTSQTESAELSSAEQAPAVKHPTSYLETLMHLFKGNVGTGLFAMGDAFKNSGIILGTFFTVFLGFICVYSEHLLLNASHDLKEQLNLKSSPDFATTVELCFANGPENIQKYSLFMKKLTNVFLCITQLGFCCVYFVFVGDSLKYVLDQYYILDIHVHMGIILIPIFLTCLIKNLKYLAPISAIANVLLISVTAVCIYYASEDTPPITSRKYVAKPHRWPLFFGTVIFAFEGIGLVIPLKNEMKNPPQFDSPFGVLNVGMTFVTVLFVIMGFMSYLKYGEEIEGSVTLNLNKGDVLAQGVQVATGGSILFTYPIQYYVVYGIIWRFLIEHCGHSSHPQFDNFFFRLALVLITFIIAEITPYLGAVISLVGSFSSSALALMIPPLLEYVMCLRMATLTKWIIVKDISIATIGILGAITGTYESLAEIVYEIKNNTDSHEVAKKVIEESRKHIIKAVKDKIY